MRNATNNLFSATVLFAFGAIAAIAALANIAAGRLMAAFFMVSVALFGAGCHLLDLMERRKE